MYASVKHVKTMEGVHASLCRSGQAPYYGTTAHLYCSQRSEMHCNSCTTRRSKPEYKCASRLLAEGEFGSRQFMHNNLPTSSRTALGEDWPQNRGPRPPHCKLSTQQTASCTGIGQAVDLIHAESVQIKADTEQALRTTIRPQSSPWASGEWQVSCHRRWLAVRVAESEPTSVRASHQPITAGHVALAIAVPSFLLIRCRLLNNAGTLLPMHTITSQPGVPRRRTASDTCRRKDAAVAPAPVAHQSAHNATTAPINTFAPRHAMFVEPNELRVSPGGVVHPPRDVPATAPVEPSVQQSRVTVAFACARAPFPALLATQLESHPVQLSDLSGNDSDGYTTSKAAAAPAAPAAASKALASADASIKAQKQRSNTTKVRRRHTNRTAAATTASSPALQAASKAQQGADLPVPPNTAAAAAAAQGAAASRRKKAVRTAFALLALLVVLLAAAAGSSAVRAIAPQTSRLSLLTSSSSSSTGTGSSITGAGSSSSDPMTSAFSPGQAAAAAVRPLDAARNAAGSVLHSAYETASGLKPAAASAAAVLGLQRSGSSSSRGLIQAAALPGWPQLASQRQVSGVVHRLRSLLHKIVSMHSGSSSSSYLADLDPVVAAAVTGDAAAAAAPATTAAAPASDSASKAATPAGAIQMYAVVDDTAVSPYKGATWGKVIKHTAQRLQWSDQRFVLNVITQQQLKSDKSVQSDLARALSSGSSSSKARPMFVGIAISDLDVAKYLRSATSDLATVLFWDSGVDLDRSSRVDGFAPATASPVAQLLAQYVGFSGEAKAAGVMKTLDSLWSRYTSDDLLFIWLVLLNEYVTPVPSVANTTKGTDLKSLYCMITNCGQKIVDCVTDKKCKSGLDCLQGCAFNDQVCQYRCIVSYETPKFEQFALCILQLHNCRGLDAQMPMVPNPAPMTTWRGAPLTHEVAESLFIGWKETGPQMPEGGATKAYSWLVAAGKNPAYDYFPCQHQLYSYGKGKGQMWYEPVFKAITLDGQEVWRRRRYRVRRGATPGTFYYSVLDNGVTSNEYWRIMDCADDLTYCLFYYSGAAAAAGLSYSGAVLATADGAWPAAYTDRIHTSLRTAGIEPWELSSVDNSQCVGAPL